MRINELGNKISDWEVKLKQQQQLYESVRSDRNLYSKNLIEAQDEIAEMKRKLKIMNHQIEQLKEDITAKVIYPDLFLRWLLPWSWLQTVPRPS